MIVFRITGGLGNQMFQAALVYTLRKYYPDVEFKIDISDYNKNPAHTGFSLEKYFTMDFTKASQGEIRKLYNGRLYTENYHVPQSEFMKRIDSLITKAAYHIYKKNDPHMVRDYRFNIFNDEVYHLQTDYDWYFHGYWQNIRYFSGYEAEIKRCFRFKRDLPEKEQILANELKQQNSVSIHVRKGDFVGSGFDLCGSDYYYRAIQKANELIPGARFYFFTDDREFVCNEFRLQDKNMVISHDAMDCDYDLQLMCACKHHIVSNSTFGFWGAYLQSGDESIVIAPEYALTKGKRSYTTQYPDTWFIIDNLERKSRE